MKDDLRSRIGTTLRQAVDRQIIAEWICCDPIDPNHELCKKGEQVRLMMASLLSDQPYPSRVIDSLMEEILAE